MLLVNHIDIHNAPVNECKSFSDVHIFSFMQNNQSDIKDVSDVHVHVVTTINSAVNEIIQYYK